MAEREFVVRKSISNSGLFQDQQLKLSHLDIELTERCNNACLHCYINLPVDDVQATRRELTTEQWKEILHQAADLGALSVRFTGGEPLLRQDFSELYLYARRLGMKVALFTNGRLITPQLAELFARIPPLMKIEVSVYGMHPWTYEAISCATGSFAEFLNGIELLKERKIPFVVKSVLLPPNRPEISEFESWSASIPGMEWDPAYVTFLNLRARRDSPARNRLIMKLRLTPEEGVKLFSRHAQRYRTDMAQFSTRFMYPQGDRLFDCGAGVSGCVDAYGSYQMCMLLRNPLVVYDLTNGSLQDALQNAFPSWREMRAVNPEYLNRCARCFLKGLCEQCPAKSWMEHGTLDTPVEYLCQVAHAQARFLGLLNAEEYGWEIKDWQLRLDFLSSESQSVKGDSPLPDRDACRGER